MMNKKIESDCIFVLAGYFSIIIMNYKYIVEKCKKIYNLMDCICGCPYQLSKNIFHNFKALDAKDILNKCMKRVNGRWHLE